MISEMYNLYQWTRRLRSLLGNSIGETISETKN